MLEPQYDLGLVALSVVIAVFVSFTALGLVSRIPAVERSEVIPWLTGGAISMGTGIWSMHFIGMLAFHLPIPVAYDPVITAYSIVIAVGGAGIALWLVRHGIDNSIKLHFSAILMATAICAMHYTGMASMRMAPGITYSPTLVGLSFLIAYGASLFALAITFGPSANPTPALFSRFNLIGAIFMGGAIAGMHYVGMVAAAFPAGSICLSAPGGLAGPTLAILVAAVCLFVLLITLVALVYDVRLAEQNARTMRMLKQRNLELEDRAREHAATMIEQIQASAQQDRLLATIVEQTHDAVITTDLEGKIISWNQAAKDMFDYEAEEVLGEKLGDIVPEHLSAQGKDSEKALTLLHNRAGTEVLVSPSINAMHDTSGEKAGCIIVLKDVTEQKKSHEQLLLLGKVFEYSGEAIMITDADNRLISVNQAFSDILGYSQEEVIGKKPSYFSSGRHDKNFYRRMWADITRKGSWKGEIWNRHKDGRLIPEWLSITTLTDNEGKVSNHIAIFTDATAFKENEARIEHLAHHDMLTGLPNRTLLEDRLGQAIAHADRHENLVAVMFIDLDRFKLINDTLGHHVGDKLLQEVALRLQMSSREEDTVSRQGGDEFIMLMQELRHADDAIIIAENLIKALSDEYSIEGHSLRVTPSIGISLYPLDANDRETLIRNADTAMYHAKDMGRANFQFFTHELNQTLSDRLDLERELRNAVAGESFTLHFQPQVNLTNQQVVGAEVLLRWFHPERGPISPNEFIPLAEDIGLIQPLGNWIIETAIRYLADWQEGPLGDLEMSINISARQLEAPGFVKNVAGLLDRYGVDSTKLKLEITETALMQDVNLSARHLALLRDLDLKIAVDDFGTGYSSMSYLKRFPINELKIDRDFIEGVSEDAHDQGITRAIIALAKTLDLQVIAEGVETGAQAVFLQQAGCRLAQGNLYAKPMSYEDLLEFIQKPTHRSRDVMDMQFSDRVQ